MAGYLPLSSFPKDPEAEDFWRAAWGTGRFAPFQHLVERDGTLSDAELDEKIPETCTLIKGHPFIIGKVDNVLVRSEYQAAYDACVEFERHDKMGNMIIVGHPGIGKTICLFVILTQRLRQRLPTFYQNDAESVFYFHESGVYTIPGKQRPSAVDWKANDIWSLFDSDEDVMKPSTLIGGMFSKWLLIMATSPRIERWSGWPKYKGRLGYFFMKPTSFSEIVMARPYQQPSVPTEAELYAFYRRFGPSARDAFMFATPSGVEAYLTSVRIALRAVGTIGFSAAFSSANGVTMDDGSHKVLLFQPLPDNRQKFFVSVITKDVMEMLWDMYLRHRTDRVQDFAALFVSHPSSKVTAGWLLDIRAHHALLQGRSWMLHPLQAAPEGKFIHYSHTPTVTDASISTSAGTSSFVEIPGSPETLFSMDGPIPDFKLGHYYRSTEQNNATFDSLMFTHEDGRDYVTMFQVTTAATHDVNEKGLRFLEAALGIPNGTASIPSPRIRYVLVVLAGAEAECTFPKEWAEKWSDILQVCALEFRLKRRSDCD